MDTWKSLNLRYFRASIIPLVLVYCLSPLTAHASFTVTLQPSATICDFESHAYLWPLCELHFLPENAGHCRRLKCYLLHT